MKAICIDGKPTAEDTTGFSLPEGIPLEVYESSEIPRHYWVVGYERDPEDGVLTVWHERRFVPLSDIDETEFARLRLKTITV